MNIHTQKHRHYVAGPIFAVLMLVFVAHGGLPASGASLVNLTQTQEEGSSFVLSNGVRGLLFDGGEMEADDEVIDLIEGSLLVESEGLYEVRTQNGGIHAWNGALHVTAHDDSLTVAAITTPALITQGEQRMLIPAHTQWRIEGVLPSVSGGYDLWAGARSVVPIPDHFFGVQFKNLSEVPMAEENLPEAHGEQIFPFRAQLLRFQRSDELLKNEWIEHVLGALRHAVEAGDTDAVSHMLADNNLSDAFASPRALHVIGTLLAREAEGSTVANPIVKALSEREIPWMLLSVHDLHRALIWTLPEPDGVLESKLVRLLMLPQADTTEHSIPSFTMRRWAQEVPQVARKLEDPAPFAEKLIEVLTPRVGVQDANGHPERARRLADGLYEAGFLFGEDLSASTMQQLQSLRTLDRVQIDEEEVTTKPEESLPVPEEPKEEEEVFDAPLAEEQAKKILHQIGALFSLETILKATSQDTVTVRAIIFASESQGDRLFNFTLNVRTRDVGNIEQDGKIFPYAMSLEAFVGWVRK